MTAALAIAILALILSFITAISITVLVSRALQNSFQLVSNMHIRSAKQLDKTLDRLMTINWEQFVSAQSQQTPDEGFWEGPDTFPKAQLSSEGITQEIPDVWGRLRTFVDGPPEDGQDLIEEDLAPSEAPTEVTRENR